MIQNESMNDTDARRFLLGEMAESERLAFEQSFVVDGGLFEQIRVVEDELIESYVRGTLSADEREKFERIFLITKRRRQRVSFSRLMLDKLEQRKETAALKGFESRESTPSVWDSLAGFFKTPRFALGVVFAVLLLIFGGWLLLRDVNKTRIARQTIPTPTIQNTPSPQNPINQNESGKTPADRNASPKTIKEAPNKNQNSNAQKDDSTLILALFAGTVRAEGKLSTLTLPKDAANASLQLHLESEEYKIYRVEIVDANGNLVFQLNNLKPKNSVISLLVPIAKLAGGDYLVKLSALNPHHENESVADYPFRVNHQ